MNTKDVDIEHYHISSKMWEKVLSIDIYLDHKTKEARIIDSHNPDNRVNITAHDWNELINQILGNRIGKIRL